jgi:hypothetical protein
MLYTYKYTENHIIEKLQQYIEFFFESMFLENVDSFSDDLIHTDFKSLVKECNKLGGLLKSIFEEYKQLHKSSRDLITLGFRNNNLIEKLCAGEIEPIHYIDIPEPLRAHLEDLFIYLYTGVLNRETFISQHCEMKSHFRASRELNKKYKFCPFCGLYPLSTKYDDYRDDYDHYLPKTKYPFNSVNFKNLVPMCDKCNKKYKKTKDPLFKEDDRNKRRKAFYPYDQLIDSLEFNVTVVNQGKIPIIDDVLNIEITSTLGRNEEIECWNDVFEVKKRYIDKIKDNIEIWMGFFFEHIYKKERNKPGFNFSEIFEDYIQDLEMFHFEDQNFLKVAALKCLASVYELEEILNDTLSA